MEYPLRDKRLSMLELLNRLLKEARARDEDVLWLEFYRHSGGGERSRLQVHEPRFDIVDALGVSGGEAIGMLRDLGDDRYVRLQLDRNGFDAGAGLVGVTLTRKGLEAIRPLPVERDIKASKKYPQWERQKKLLRAVHDWYEAQTDTRAQLRYPDLVALVEDPAYEGILTSTGAQHDETAIDNAHARVMNLFVVLVKDGYIDADISTAIVGLPFTSATLRGLIDKGLRAIAEMPDPGEEIERFELEKQRQVQKTREEVLAEPLSVREAEDVRYDVWVDPAPDGLPLRTTTWIPKTSRKAYAPSWSIDHPDSTKPKTDDKPRNHFRRYADQSKGQLGRLMAKDAPRTPRQRQVALTG